MKSIDSISKDFRKVQLAPCRDQGGRIVAQKVRGANKKFSPTGDYEIDKLQLFGQHLWLYNGRRVVIAEGELDAMSLSQAQGNKWPVVVLSMASIIYILSSLLRDRQAPAVWSAPLAVQRSACRDSRG